MSSAVIGGFCEHSPVVHEPVAKFADHRFFFNIGFI
jgi:hypothetical protein